MKGADPYIRRTEMNALELLRNDHVAARGLLDDLNKMAGEAPRKKIMAMLNLIEREVKIHSEIEERIFYPAFRKAAQAQGDKDLIHDAVEEHHLVDVVLPDLKILALKKDELGAKLRLASQLVVKHIEKEENEMFPRARKILGPEKLDQLGKKMTTEKEKLFKSWTGTVTAPLHRAKSLVDKVTPLAVKEAKVKAHAKAGGPLQRKPPGKAPTAHKAKK